MIHYYLRNIHKIKDLKSNFQKIIDYLLTFVGDIEVKKETKEKAFIYYLETPTVAHLKLEKTGQVTVTISKDDNVTINLINNVAVGCGFRIYNPQINCYLPNSANILDLTTIKIDPTIKNVLNLYQLTPLFQYRDTLIFFCLNKKMEVVLVNRHLLEYLLTTNGQDLIVNEFSIKVAENIPQFIALFDRGLISLNFPQYLNGDAKITNLSGFNIKKLPINTKLQVINFIFNEENQSFTQTDTTNEIPKKYLAIKIGQDYTYKMIGDKLTKFINVSVFN
ncbi:MAG: hypothetical protein UR39_C0011G0025 [Candidatus Woesebacteria bacterium GW2011_GWA1_33_30]|uniref:Uncharacterized protein n=1 Tax=Candidatus Woesebacteria bacterium GW2011_GWA2_33_28 TaxID=1618561 RepID=A0A0F9ZQ13_9BACT|nr:MAG: hypothetical protein UR38_C0011G0023 [Candidatus Woesebacteria bacterium GW2011_GWA2_33_28]KKP47073.1 MAG: hypothetical protein UR39_C0011G0025 [Candidatus Woesebacteria bacterium GW2011_GWA1_33_30]KKP48687.1 MAG: hypothetical protein UR40_C0012G0023 [Microgenomates group bacterium GW2011_GWC1_33_32]KKP51396.1 MAG: hypothetical protein UR44_C0011G0023 [Candidatus Woesebacteria bacterium GW2011_GWB1_33_38]KKP57435.1 MAG: hypothetical protein UR48_C0017G0008 [Microgenomates group bacteriu